ncbi:hypothetical protein EG329_008122 [Mollisiaceae sp. DMI_Dod_QoI]|nr:hypothetical protein EG329_008122 [Helotiales sp. DMI_Dod_QoI]
MSATMREWIAPTVKFQFTEVLKKLGHEDGFPNSDPALKIHLTKPRTVQIIHLRGTSLVKLSDGKTFIEAEFGEVAVESFQQSTGRSFYELRGAVVAITDYDIQPCMRLFVRNFKLRGAEGSARFGSPSDIIQEPKLRQIVEELGDAFRSGQEDQASAVSWPPSPIRSQDGNYLDSGNSFSVVPDPNTNFGTQIATQIDGNREATGIAKAVSKGAPQDLLALLKNPLMAKISTKPAGNERHTQGSASPIPTVAPSSILRPVSDQRVKGMTTMLEAKANKQQIPVSTQYSASRSLGYPKGESLTTKPRGTESGTPPSDDSEKENSQESLNRGKRVVSKDISSPTTPTTLPDSHKSSAPFVDLFQGPKPFEGLKRVPRKFVRIPEAQHELLERKDSWYEPNSEGRHTYATVPPKVRQELDQFLDKQRHRTIGNQSDDENDDHVESTDSDGSEDEKEPEEEQPASSTTHRDRVRDDLPMDATTASSANIVSTPSPRLCHAPNHTFDISHGAGSLSSSGPRPTLRIEKLDVDDQMSDDGSISCFSSPVRDVNESECRNVLTQAYSISKNKPEKDLAWETRTLNAESFVPGCSARPVSSASSRRCIEPPKIPAVRPRIRMPIIPSSSPVEEELELAVPYAVGDVVEVEEHEEPSDVPKTSQELPCTAPVDTKLIQVERTPYADLREASTEDLFRGRESKSGKNQISDDIFSDAVIPATFDNSKSCDETPMLKDDVLVRITNSQGSRGPGLTSPPTKYEQSLEVTEDLDTIRLNGSTSTSLKEQVISSSPISKPESPIVQIPATGRKSEQSSTCGSSPTHIPKRTARVLDPNHEGMPLQYEKTSTTKQEEYNIRGSKEMVKAARHSYLKTLPQEMARTARHNFLKTLAQEQELGHKSVSQPSNTGDIKVSSATDAGVRISSTYKEASLEDAPSADQDYRFEAQPLTSPTARPLEGPAVGGEGAMPPTVNAIESPIALEPENPSFEDNGAIVPAEHIEFCSSQLMYYDEFKVTYPDYEGSMDAFTRALVYLEWLQKDCGTTMRYYDDFVRVLDSDHKKHIMKYQHDKERLLTGFKFYNRHVLEPVYRYNVISPKNIKAALLTLDRNRVEEMRAKFWESEERDSQSITKSNEHQTSSTVHDVTPNGAHTTSWRRDSQDISSSPGVSLPPKKTLLVPRRRFFETASQQVCADKHKAAVGTPIRAAATANRSSQVSSNESGSKNKSGRRLYWSEKKVNKFASPEPPKARASLPGSSSACRGERIDFRKLRREREEWEAARVRQNLMSPILGSLRDPSPKSRESKHKRLPEHPPSRELEDPFTASSKPSNAARRATMPAEGMYENSPATKRKRTSESLPFESLEAAPKPSKAARRVTLPATGVDRAKEWVQKTPVKKMTAFEIRVARMSLSGSGKLPKSSRIKRETGKSYCTIKKTDQSAEANTQEWNF